VTSPGPNGSAGAASRVADLLGHMTLEEKVAQLGGTWVTALVREDRFDPALARERLAHGTGHVTRIGGSTGLRPGESAALANAIQRFLVEETRLGIPAIVHEESVAGFCARDATVFPQAIGLASTWNPALIEAVAGVVREQMRAVGARQTLAPVLDVARDPRWGRVEETYGEDPVLAGTLGTAYVRGLQTADLRAGIACTGKHFLGYGLSEGGMNHAPVHLGPRELREVFAEPFAAAIRDAGLASIMNSYASIDGVPCAASADVLRRLLRDELGFDGVTVADYFAVALLITHHHTAADAAGAAEQALRAGLDVELPALDCYATLADAVRAGCLPEPILDEAVERILTLKMRLGLFDAPYVDAARAGRVFDTPAQRALARRAATESICLLTNNGVLPLAHPLHRIAVVGPAADDPRLLQGDYHYPAHLEIVYEDADVPLLPAAGGVFRPGPYFTRHVTPLAALRTALGPETEITYARGCDVSDARDADVAAAARVAADADVALVFVGGRSGLTASCTVGEARDATRLGLTGEQPVLVDAVLATGTPTIVVLMGGRVFTVPEIAARAGALVQAWLPGEEGGSAIADVLLGRVDPGGRLPICMPRHVGQVPVHHRHRAGGGRSAFHGAYTDAEATPLFPFGHGLSYTTITWDEMIVESGSTTDELLVGAQATNEGSRAGTDVVQLYVRDLVASVARPVRELVGFARVTLAPGESRRVTFRIHPSRLAFHDPAMRLVVEPGDFEVVLAASASRDHARQRVTLGGGVATYRRDAIVATAVTIE
jgi:beta-glucosidase